MECLRKPLRLAVLIAALALVATASARAEDYPARPIKTIVPFAAGGPSDIVMRIVGQRMGMVLGQPIIVENRGGAGGRVGVEAGARATPDGYTITLVNTSTHGISPVTTAALGYHPLDSFALIGLVGTYPLVLICNPKVPAHTVPELIEYIRKNPGKVSYGSPGVGGQGHFAGEFFKARAGVEMLHVPYRGNGPVLQDVMAGVIDCVFVDGTSRPHIEAGRVRAFALTSMRRSPLYPGVPTLDETGLKGLDMTTWMGLAAPAGTPPQAVEKLIAALRVALEDNQVIEGLLRTGTAVAEEVSPASLRRRIEDDIAMYGRIAKEAHIKVE